MNPRLFFCFAIIISILLTSCQDHKPDIETFGQIDSAAIAADTTMQVNMERSYEYQRTFAEGDTVAYDFLAYDKPKGSSSPEWESKFILIRRQRIGQDTVARDFRSGPVRGSWMSDLDGNGKREFFFYEYPDTGGWSRLYGYESNGTNRMTKITTILKNDKAHYRGGDTFFVSNDLVVRLAPYYNAQTDTVASSQQRQQYKLVNSRLVFAGENRQ
ncbi:MAG: hypothetical protein JST83_18335 [Bacteroidetes bacterium]|nr:hypothetical protein [Bacteroidota bacterium]